MSLTPSKVTWDPNRYKAHEYVITYDSNGNPTLSKKEASYTGVNYNFSSLPTQIFYLVITIQGHQVKYRNQQAQNSTGLDFSYQN